MAPETEPQPQPQPHPILSFTLQTETLVKLTPKTSRFRKLAQQDVQKDDHVLEIGCSTGGTSEWIWKQQPQSWLGIDVSEIMIKATQDKLDHLDTQRKTYQCRRIDALMQPDQVTQLATASHVAGPTVVLVDIGGNRDSLAVVRMLKFVTSRFQNLRLVVVKSEGLYEQLRSSQSTNRQAWLDEQYCIARVKSMPKHPLKAPLVRTPEGRLVCRYYNYHPKGCKKGDDCPFEHRCHVCLDISHKARQCTAFL